MGVVAPHEPRGIFLCRILPVYESWHILKIIASSFSAAAHRSNSLILCRNKQEQSILALPFVNFFLPP
jgi:hypothetical protein